MATAQATKLDQLRGQHEKALDENRDLGVIAWKNGEKQSDKVYEVQDGYVTLPGAGEKGTPLRIGPGMRFRPTERQVEANSFRGKARELTATEYRSIQRDERKVVSKGADFREMGLKAVAMADGTRQAAYDGGLAAEDFEGLEPSFGDQFTRNQVEALIEQKKQQAG